MTRTPAKAAPLFRIQAVAQATGVSEHSLRVWERRYGELASTRSPSGYRLYTERDVARIRMLRELLDEGHAIGEIAPLSLSDLERLRRPPRPATEPALPQPVAEVARRRFLDAISRMNAELAQQVLASAAVAFTTYELLTAIIVPILRELGDGWQRGEFTVAQEHAASAVIRQQLGDLLRTARPRDDAPTLIATTPEGEHHEFGAMLAAIAATAEGARVLYLGPNTPARDLASAAEAAGARAALLSILALEETSARARIAEARAALPRGVALWVGGPHALGALPAGVTWTASLDDVRARTAALR